MTTFAPHDVTGRWDHNFTDTRNKDFVNLVQNARLAPPPPEPTPVAGDPAAATCAFDWIPPPGAIIVTTKITATVSSCTATAAAISPPALPTGAMAVPRAVETVYVTL
jgi:hypothetical protein